MNNKEITRKEFLVLTGSVLTVLFTSGIPSKIIKNISARKNTQIKNTNNAYGGKKITSQ
jgi:hypothetical protein